MPKSTVFALMHKYVEKNKRLTVIDLYKFKCLGALILKFKNVAAILSTAATEFLVISEWTLLCHMRQLTPVSRQYNQNSTVALISFQRGRCLHWINVLLALWN